MSELFELGESLHPKIIWAREHGITLSKNAAGKFECALDEENYSVGDTEEQAIEKFCEITGLPHWKKPWYEN